MTLTLNGEERSFSGLTHLASLVEALGLVGAVIASADPLRATRLEPSRVAVSAP